jgi:hypothetical protein
LTTPDRSGRTPGSSRHRIATESPQPGAPSRALRLRAAGGWEKFMRRTEMQKEGEA